MTANSNKKGHLKGRFEAIFWDLDGTLIDSISGLFVVYQQFLQAYGHQGSWEAFQALNGPSLPSVVAQLQQKYDLPQPHNKLLSVYQSMIQDYYLYQIPAMPGADNVLKMLHQNGVRLGLVTSASRDLAYAILTRLNWLGFFEYLITGDAVLHSKPHPAIYQVALARFDLAPNQAIAIEDSYHGIAAAQGAGLSVIGLQGPSLGAAQPTYCISHLSDSLAIVLQPGQPNAM